MAHQTSNIDRSAETHPRHRHNWQRIVQFFLKFTFPQYPSDPTNPVEGQVYYNTASKHFFGWNGTAWKQLDN